MNAENMLSKIKAALIRVAQAFVDCGVNMNEVR